MRLQFIQPRKELSAYITKIWLFEHSAGFANSGTLIAPNARAKIIIPYKSQLITTGQKKTDVCKEGDIFFIGIRDVPVVLSTPPQPTGSIGIELTTQGACRFLSHPMYHLTNNLFSFTDLFPGKAGQITHRINDEEEPLIKVQLIQQFLLDQLCIQKSPNTLFNYAVNFISSYHGLVTIKQLEQKTGYSKRYLDMLFKTHLGISPKTFATIQRFQRFYKLFGEDKNISIYDQYYDQAHFIKEFKRYTGLTPVQYTKFDNGFGKHF